MSGLNIEKEIWIIRSKIHSPSIRDIETQQRLYFELAAFLACSQSPSELNESFDLLDMLLRLNYRKSECLYQLALVSLKLGRYREAKQFANALAKLEHLNIGALSLQSIVIDRIACDAIHGAITGLSILGVLTYIVIKTPKIRMFLHRLCSSLAYRL